MLDSPEDAPVRGIARPSGHPDDAARHRDHGPVHLLAVQPDPGDARRHPRHRRVDPARRLRAGAVPAAAGCSPRSSRPAPSSACSRSSSCSSRSCAARLERIGRVGTFGWLLAPAEQRTIEHVAAEVAKAAGQLSREGHGALIVLERETGLEEIAETGVMVHARPHRASSCARSSCPRTALHDGAVIIRDDRILAAGGAAAAHRDDPRPSASAPATGRRSGSPRTPTRWPWSCPRRAAR